MTKQQRDEIKQVINLEFGFDTKKIVLLEYGGLTVFDTHNYIMFEVCGIQYQMRWDNMKDKYNLNVYCNESGLTKEII